MLPPDIKHHEMKLFIKKMNFHTHETEKKKKPKNNKNPNKHKTTNAILIQEKAKYSHTPLSSDANCNS